MQQCIKILFHIYMKLNVFRATHRPSSGAESVQQLHVQQPSTYAKPEAASAVLGSWLWGGVSPETCWASYKYEIKHFDTLLHLVGFSMWIILWCTDPRTSSIIYSLYVICSNCTKKITAILRHIPNLYQPTGRKHCTPNHREISASLSNGTDCDGGCDSFYYFHPLLSPSSRTCEVHSIVMHVRNC